MIIKNMAYWKAKGGISPLKQTDKEKRLLEIKRQRALLNNKKEFEEEKESETVKYNKLDDDKVVGGTLPGGPGDFYKQAKKLINLDYGVKPVNE